MKGNSLVPFILIFAFGAVLIASSTLFQQYEIPTNPELKKFSSCSELKDFTKLGSEIPYYYGGGLETFATTGAKTAEAPSASTDRSEDYSTTNVQVTGVDEPDIVKNDGKYIYVASSKKVVIVDAYPAENAKIISEIEFNSTVNEIFVNKDRLVVFGQVERNYWPVVEESAPMVKGYMPPYYSQQMFIKVYDISDRSKPILKRNITLDGNYYDSRMIGDYIYVIANQPVNFYGEDIVLPQIATGSVPKPLCRCADVYYFDIPDYSYNLMTILALNSQDDRQDLTSKVFLKGSAQNMYVSTSNIYITNRKQFSQTEYQNMIYEKVISQVVPADIAAKMDQIRSSDFSSYEKWRQIAELVQNYSSSLNAEKEAEFQKNYQDKMAGVQQEIAKILEKTVVHKISVDGSNIEYKTQGEFPGSVLNQFSMDEYNGYFRVATTTRENWGGPLMRIGWQANSKNHVYVLDSSLTLVGKLEDLAPGESIYSARFMSDRCYLVTFKKTDPLFVIDLKDPSNPRVLGKLKIPGYSDYLHPYDENHIIGLGKEAVEAEQGDFAWYQGVKLSLFDVTDVANPKEISKYNIGDRGTDSYALHDHKAFLFSKSKGIIVIPILLAEIDEAKYPNGVSDNAYGDYVWQGAYVLGISLDSGFTLKAKITHSEDSSDLIKSGYYYSSPYSVKRSLYIGNAIYTLSDKTIKMNSLDNFAEINKVTLPFEDINYWERPGMV
jgi:uncharacterized secreted protein with C-terminal beta-propeller domain